MEQMIINKHAEKDENGEVIQAKDDNGNPIKKPFNPENEINRKIIQLKKYDINGPGWGVWGL